MRRIVITAFIFLIVLTGAAYAADVYSCVGHTSGHEICKMELCILRLTGGL